MDDNTYLIPANSKKSMLIFGFFNKVDLIIAVTGIFFTFLMLMIVRSPSFIQMILIILPLLVSSLLVMPVPHYHNVLQLIINIYSYIFISQKNYRWKGWSASEHEAEKEK